MSILIVDDDLAIRREVAEILGEEGIEVLSASNGAEGLRLLRAMRVPPSLILLDLVMPGTDGWELRRAQLEDPVLARIPVLVFSSFDGGPREVVELGAAGHLTKPFTIAELMAAIARFVQPKSVS